MLPVEREMLDHPWMIWWQGPVRTITIVNQTISRLDKCFEDGRFSWETTLRWRRNFWDLYVIQREME